MTCGVFLLLQNKKGLLNLLGLVLIPDETACKEDGRQYYVLIIVTDPRDQITRDDYEKGHDEHAADFRDDVLVEVQLEIFDYVAVLAHIFRHLHEVTADAVNNGNAQKEEGVEYPVDEARVAGTGDPKHWEWGAYVDEDHVDGLLEAVIELLVKERRGHYDCDSTQSVQYVKLLLRRSGELVTDALEFVH